MQLLVQQISQALHHSCLGALFRSLFIDRVVPDKLACTLARNPCMLGQTRVSHRIVAWYLDNVGTVRIEIVSNVFRKRLLLV
jgi:hypothetical protein